METLRIIRKVAGIRGAALRALFALLRSVNRKTVFSNLTWNRVCKSTPVVLMLIHSIACTGTTTRPVATVALSKSPKQRVVVAMDSPLFVYDAENRNRSGRTNLDEIVNALARVKGLTVYKEKTSLQWNRERQVKSMNPDLITMHLSAFGSSNETLATRKAEEQKIMSFFRDMADSHAQFLVYSRSPFLENAKGQQAWIQTIERRVPQLRNRIRFFNFADRPKRFRDSEVQRALRRQVATILGIPER